MDLWATHEKRRLRVDGVNGDTTVKELAERLEELTGLKSEFQRIIWRGKLLSSDGRSLREVGIPEDDSTSLLVVGPAEEAVEKMKGLQSDQAMRPFEESIPVKRKYEAKLTPARMRSKYTFLRTETIAGLHDEDRAAELLRQLCEDRGIAAVMEKHRWMVGNLKEMYPDGKVGVDPVCVLGLNVNMGAEIRIRLRTDDLRGFRPYYKLREVVFHELSHNVHSEHNRDFYDLMNEVAKEADAHDWTKSKGQSVGGSASLTSPSYHAHAEASTPAIQRPVGGDMQTKRSMSARAAAAAAAAARLGKAYLHTQDVKEANITYMEVQRDEVISRPEVDQEVEISDGEDVADVSRSGSPPAMNERDQTGNTEDVIMADTAITSPREEVQDQTSADAENTGDSEINTSSQDAEQQALELLQAMGFDEDIAKRALSACDSDPDRAANWIMSRFQPSATPLPVPPSSPPAANTANNLETSVQMLVSMGFSASASAQALRSHPDDLEAAVNWIVSRGLS
mmetsp:Transcript_6781/g.20562  ORF Transcript_6781/g.20562 Transcript_6781/m.20562 type:complete len:510 (+) Transcript_6781:133-1662(+)